MKPLADSPEAPPARNAARARANAGRHRRRWLPLTGAALLVALIVAGLWPQPLPVETAAVTRGPLRAVIAEEGKTRVRHRYIVSAPVTGRLRRITLDPGDEVRAGQTVVAVIDPPPASPLDLRSRALAEARRDSAAANLEKARAALKFASNELERFNELFATQAISIQELEVAQWRQTAAAREAAAAESALRQAEAELAQFNAEGDGGTNSPAAVEIKAPANGRVLHILQESSTVVAVGTPLLEIGDPTDLEVVIEVLSRDGATLAPGTPVELEHWGGREPLRAAVRLVEPAAFTKVSALGVEEQRVNVIADLLTPPEQRANLGDNFRVEARIITWQADHALRVPTGALFRRGEEWRVFVIREGRAAVRSVKLGHVAGTHAEVLEGLSENDAVILYPGDRVREGRRVRPITV